MPLLTKNERRALTRSERIALRKERRALRIERRPTGDGLEVRPKALAALAATMILDMADDEISATEKMDTVLDELVEHADEYLKWTWLGPAGFFMELADGPALKALVRALIRPHVQRAYDELSASVQRIGKHHE